MKNKKTEKLLYKSFDVSLNKEEAEQLESALKNSAGLKKEYDEIKELREEIKNSAVTSFKPFFEERLLNKLNNSSSAQNMFWDAQNSFVISFRKIGLTAICILIILLSYNLKSGNSYSIKNIFGISNAGIEYAFDPVQSLMRSDK
jgi:hypothetical protein